MEEAFSCHLFSLKQLLFQATNIKIFAISFIFYIIPLMRHFILEAA